MAFSTMNIVRMGRRGVNLAALNLGVAAYKNRITRNAYNFAATAIGALAGRIPGSGYRVETTRKAIKIAENIQIERSFQLGGSVIFDSFLELGGMRNAEYSPFMVTGAGVPRRFWQLSNLAFLLTQHFALAKTVECGIGEESQKTPAAR